MIRHLSDDVRACIRTGVALTSFAQAVEELVLNSIDAGSTNIAVRVDLSFFKIQVVDNGAGITLSQFQLVGERYATSKCHCTEDLDNLKYFGYRGEALASLSKAASCLEIVSRPKSSSITYSKCYQYGKVLGVIQAPQPRPSAGTTVTAHDLFYNLPVRRKCLNEGLEMEKIRYRLAGIALIWPQISISLRDDSVGHVILQTNKCSGMAAAFSDVFTPARARGLMEVSAEQDEFKLSGLVSKDSYSRKDLQFVFVNRRLVLKSSIHRQINKILGRSMILRRKGLNNEVFEKLLQAGGTQTGSPTKQSERYGVFVINVECPYCEYDITFDPSKTLVEFRNWPKLIHLLQDMLYGFLRKENLIFVPDPSSTTSPYDANDNDEEEEADNHDEVGNYVTTESVLPAPDGSSHDVENEENKKMSQLRNSGKSISMAVENGIFSKPVCRPRQQSPEREHVSLGEDAIPGQNRMQKTHLSTSRQEISSEPDPSTSEGKKIGSQRIQYSSELPEASDFNAPASLGKGSETTPIYAQSSEQFNKSVSTAPDEKMVSAKRPLNIVTKKVTFEDAVVRSEHTPVQQAQASVSASMRPGTTNSAVSSRHDSFVALEQGTFKKQDIQSTKRKEITLGNAVHYSSTLRSLREIRPIATPGNVPQIITNTLTQLKESTKTNVKDLGDLYKTPERVTRHTSLNQDNASPTKQPRLEEGVVTLPQHTDRLKNQPAPNDYLNGFGTKPATKLSDSLQAHDHKTDSLHKKGTAIQIPSLNLRVRQTSREDSHSSALYKSSTEDRCLGQNDKMVSLKRAPSLKMSHAMKLAKLMKGERIRDPPSDTENDDREKHAQVLQSFSYSRHARCAHSRHSQSAGHNPTSASTSTPKISSDETDNQVCDAAETDPAEYVALSTSENLHPSIASTSISIAIGNDREGWTPLKPTTSHKLVSGDRDTEGSERMNWTHVKQVSCKAQNSSLSTASSECCSCRAACQSERPVNPPGETLPFIMYKTPENVVRHANGETEDMPRVSVILSLPIEPLKTKTTQCSHENKALTQPVWSNSYPVPSLYSSRSRKRKTLASGCSGSSCTETTSEHHSDCDTQNSSKDFHTSSSQSQVDNDHMEDSLSTPPLSQGFSVATLPSTRDAENSSDDLSPHISGCRTTRTDNDNTPSGFDSSGFSPANDSLFLTKDDFSSHGMLEKTYHYESDNSCTPRNDNPHSDYSDSDSDFYIIKKPPEMRLHSACNVPASKYQNQDLDLQIKSEKPDKETMASQKPLLTCSSSQSSYFRMTSNMSSQVANVAEEGITTSDETVMPKTVATEGDKESASMASSFETMGNITANKNDDHSPPVIEPVATEVSTEVCNNSQILAYDSLSCHPDINTIPETEEFDGLEVIEKSDGTDTHHEYDKTVRPQGGAISEEEKNMAEFRALAANAKSIHDDGTPLKTCVHPENDSASCGDDISSSCTNNKLIKELDDPELSIIGSGCLESHQKCEGDAAVQSSEHDQHQLNSNLNLRNNDASFSCPQQLQNSQDGSFSVQDASSNESIPCGQRSKNNSQLEDTISSTGVSFPISDVPSQVTGLKPGNVSPSFEKNKSEKTLIHVNDGSESLFENSEGFRNQGMDAFSDTLQNIFRDMNAKDEKMLSQNVNIGYPSATSGEKQDDPHEDSSTTVSDAEATQPGVQAGQDPSRFKNTAETQLDLSSFHQDQMDVMSSAGDQALLLVELPPGSSILKSVNKDSSKTVIMGQRETDTYPGASSSKVMADICHENGVEAESGKDALPSLTVLEGQSSPHLPVTTANPCNAQVRLPISLCGVHSSSMGPSSLFLLRPTKEPVREVPAGDQTCRQEISSGDADLTLRMKLPGPKLDSSFNNATGVKQMKRMSVEELKRLDVMEENQSGLKKSSCHVTESGDGDHQENEKNGAEAKACWKEVMDSETGRRMYINNLSGHTVSEEQWSEIPSRVQREMLAVASDCHSMEAKPTSSVTPLSASKRVALEDMVSKHFEQEESDAVSKWREGSRPVYDQEAGVNISTVLAKWTNPVFLNYKQPALVASACPSGTVARSCFHSLSAVEFTKDMLNYVKVIGQLDNKFIACLIEKPQGQTKGFNSKPGNLLVLFDQHAVHERIRLEHLTEDSYEVENGERTDRLKKSEVTPAQPLIMDQDDLRIMKAFSKEFERIGVSFTADKSSRSTVHIKCVPTCIAEKDASDSKKSKAVGVTDSVESLIKEHIDLLKSTNGACGRLPLAVHKVLCSQACHGAVKFGDQLTLKECQDLLSSLASCNLPFQCAHGRPSVAPLVDLSALEKELTNLTKPPHLWKIGKHLAK